VTASGPGWVYLLHFEREIGSEDNPRGRAGHYLGHTGRDDLDARLAEHKAGRGARLTQVLLEQGVQWKLVRTWPGGRDLERALKDQHHANRLCPECQPTPQPGTTRKPLPVTDRKPAEHTPPAASPPRKLSPYDQGTRTAEQLVRAQIAAGKTPAEIGAWFAYITGPSRSGEIRHTPESATQMEGFQERYEELMHDYRQSRQRETGKDPAVEGDKKPQPHHPPAPRRQGLNPDPSPAPGYQKGVAAAHTLILQQVDADRHRRDLPPRTFAEAALMARIQAAGMREAFGQREAQAAEADREMGS
jgi:hypothetical protein